MHPFAERFAAAWSKPTPEDLVALLAPEVVLLQPHRPPIRGRAAALAEMRALLAWLPDLHGVIDRASGDDTAVFIEWRMHLARAGKPVLAVDRFLLRDGLGVERRVYFDQVQMIGQVVARPRLWPGFIRYRFGSRPR